MILAEFGKEMDRLKKAYPHKPHAYPDERVALIYDWAKNIDARIFTAVVSRLIEDNEHPPMLTKFKEVFGLIRDHFTLPKDIEKCERCDGRGLIYAYSKKNPDNILAGADFACGFCPRGKDHKGLKYWQESDFENYIPRFSENHEIEYQGVTVNVRALIQNTFKKAEAV